MQFTSAGGSRTFTLTFIMFPESLEAEAANGSSHPSFIGTSLPALTGTSWAAINLYTKGDAASRHANTEE